ncbi:serine protease [Nocardioides caeni]|uniref:Trypsin-like peptidase domain-containing protein n=1 Tax=Nocardioides caeni TaxID=574700 RepID=A0A4S8N8Y4_9ACTN|nr:serine protease [Nocardioides caeni]THV12172.1 trypsin-like peptidase domain-containing protein [Nocardioides caeni]
MSHTMKHSVRGALAATGTLVALTALTAVATPAQAEESAAPTEADRAAEVAALTQPGVVQEEIWFGANVWSETLGDYISGEPTWVSYVCSGFVVSPDGWIATAGHCVSNDRQVADDIEQQLIEEWVADDPTWDAEFLASDFSVFTEDVEREVYVTLPAAVTGSDVREDLLARVIDEQTVEQGDAALLKIEADGLNGLALAEADPEIGQEITSVGYPAIVEDATTDDLTPTFQPGTISSEKTFDGEYTPVYQLSQDLEGGMSGGPVVNGDGEVIGLISAGFDGTDLSYAAPVARLTELLAANGVDPVLSESSTAFRDGVRAFYDSDRETSVAQLQAVVDDQPRNTAAADYLERAEALPVAEKPKADDKDGEDAMSNVWIIVGIVAGSTVLIAAIVVAAVAVSRRRATRQTAYGQVGSWPAQPVQPVAPVAPGFAAQPGQQYAQQPGQQPGQQYGQQYGQPPVGFAPQGQPSPTTHRWQG